VCDVEVESVCVCVEKERGGGRERERKSSNDFSVFFLSFSSLLLYSDYKHTHMQTSTFAVTFSTVMA
jgi:hypothetical protein